MASIQAAYGHADAFAPGVFDYYDQAGVNVAGTSIVLQTSKLVLVNGTGAMTTLTVTLPLNPPDGCEAELNAVTNGVTTLTLNANTGDLLAGPAASALVAATPVRFKYALNGDITKGVKPRTWIRVQ
jgi:hypothetical protein